MQDPAAFIPHRPPALCIDTVLAVDEVCARTRRTVPEEATLDDDRIWEPWLIEGLAQTAAVLNGSNEPASGGPPTKGMLVGIRNLEIRYRPRAGDLLEFETTLIRRIPPLTLIAGRIFLRTAETEDNDRGEEIAAGEMKFYVETTP